MCSIITRDPRGRQIRVTVVPVLAALWPLPRRRLPALNEVLREEAAMATTGQASIIGAQAFLRHLPASYVERLSAMARHVCIPAHTRLFEEGNPARAFWLIDAGQVAIDTLVPGVGRVTIEQLGRGDVLGLGWLHQPYQYDYGAVATQPMQAFEFDAAAVRAACDEDPALGYALFERFLAIAAHRLQATRSRLIDVDWRPRAAVT
jgi:CRP-like cAMP-binding protein